MRLPKTAYELRQSQVSTPPEVVALFWRLLRERRTVPGKVLDLGAGDGRFAQGGYFERYDGIEIDPSASEGAILPANARITTGCAFAAAKKGYDACIGNPPYVRHHDIEQPWKGRVAETIEDELGVTISGIGNLYLYFLCLALLRTKKDGLVAFIVPFEWVSRPSARSIRDLLGSKGWKVSIYRFDAAIFEGVLTTASITIIDKAETKGRWSYYDILEDLTVRPRNGISGSRLGLLPYSSRDKVWARRGISPGGQKTFTLTEDERLEAGLYKTDVWPCITSLKHLPADVSDLNDEAFQKYFVDAGRRCWLIKTTKEKLSKRLRSYLKAIPKSDRETYACLHQTPWYNYESVPVPKLIFHSGFMKRGPKVAINSVGAQAVGCVYGVHSDEPTLPLRKLQGFLSDYNFESRIVAHAHTLRKVEVAQLNSVLSRWFKNWSEHG